MEFQHHPMLTWIFSLVSTSAIIGVLAGLVPTVAAAVALIWYLIQIYESDTVKAWRAKRRVQHIARLKARLLILESKPAPIPPEVEKKL